MRRTRHQEAVAASSNIPAHTDCTAGAALAALAYAWGDPLLMRASLSFEIGEDLVHFAQMARVTYRPTHLY